MLNIYVLLSALWFNVRTRLFWTLNAIGMPVLLRMPPELAHKASLAALRYAGRLLEPPPWWEWAEQQVRAQRKDHHA